MRRWGGIAASGLFALILLAGLRSEPAFPRPPMAIRVPQAGSSSPLPAVEPVTVPQVLVSPRPLPRIVTFDPSAPLLEPLAKELSIVYFGRPPNIKAALRTRGEEAGIALAAIVQDVKANPHARSRALSLLSEMNFPQVREALAVAAGDENLRSQAVALLGQRADPGNADVLLGLYRRQSDGLWFELNCNARILDALSNIGDARALPLIEELVQQYRELQPKVLSDPDEEVQSVRAQLEADFRGQIAGLQHLQKLIAIANGPDPVSAAIPLLYDLNGGDYQWAFRLLERLDPPTFSAHLRASYDQFKGRNKYFRSNNGSYEFRVLRALDQRGAPLTPDERRYLSDWDMAEGCEPPKLPD